MTILIKFCVEFCSIFKTHYQTNSSQMKYTQYNNKVYML